MFDSGQFSHSLSISLPNERIAVKFWGMLSPQHDDRHLSSSSPAYSNFPSLGSSSRLAASNYPHAGVGVGRPPVLRAVYSLDLNDETGSSFEFIPIQLEIQQMNETLLVLKCTYCGPACSCHRACAEIGGYFSELVCFFRQVGPKDRTQVTSLYLMNHLHGPSNVSQLRSHNYCKC